MKTAKKIFLAFIASGILLLLFSTKIVLLITRNVLEKKDIDTSVISSDSKFNIDIVSPQEGLLNTVYIRGWAFNVNYMPNSKRHVSVIFKADKFAYEIPTFSELREDVRDHFLEYNLTANDLGFGCTFSTIALQKGKYELFLKVWENGSEPVFVKTNKIFIKEGAQFGEVFP